MSLLEHEGPTTKVLIIDCLGSFACVGDITECDEGSSEQLDASLEPQSHPLLRITLSPPVGNPGKFSKYIKEEKKDETLSWAYALASVVIGEIVDNHQAEVFP